jgi:serine/threonine protein kinase
VATVISRRYGQHHRWVPILAYGGAAAIGFSRLTLSAHYTSLGRYKIVRLLGSGGMGSVYEAIDPSIDRRVAIKTINLASAEEPERVRERFAREARVTGNLRHPNIIKIYEVGEAEGLAFMVMEYLVGKTLGEHMKDSPPSQWPNFLPVLRPCAEALDYAHGRGVVHLDIKPDRGGRSFQTIARARSPGGISRRRRTAHRQVFGVQ